MADLALDQHEEDYLRLLATLRTAGAGAELGVVRRIATWNDSPKVLAFIAAHGPWLDDWEIKEALVRNDGTPDEVRQRAAQAVGVLDLLREIDSPDLDPVDRAELTDHVRALIQALPERDRSIVRAHALELSASRRPPTEGGEAAEPAEATEAGEVAEPAPATAAELAVSPVSPPEPEPAAAQLEPSAPPADAGKTEGEPPPVHLEPAEPAAEREGGALRRRPLAEKLALARDATEPEVLAVLADERTEEIRLALLGNPALPEAVAAAIARTSSPRVAREIYRERRLFHRPQIRRALLESPHVPSAALVEVVSSMGDLRGLLGLTQDPRVRSLEVKTRARARLTALFRSLGSAEKLATIRRTGRPLLRALWSDFFRDEELVLRCLQERGLDPGLVLEIARSSIAPRRALKAIGDSQQLAAHYPVRLALVRNPKTPRSVVQKLLPTLRPADRRAVAGARK